jgi:hypothetical protein
MQPLNAVGNAVRTGTEERNENALLQITVGSAQAKLFPATDQHGDVRRLEQIGVFEKSRLRE